ncbi:MAG: hypothetical protein MAG795_00929 [Candidatus Woesearchaeota archaeon]|nr:hypothetical protein [Candidatus Woesearchaeota archaeon]
MAKKLNLARARKLIRVVGHKDCFWLCTNQNLRSLNTLSKALDKASEDVFRYHVNKYKNDFSDWVKEVIGDSDFAREISRIKTKDTLVRKIQEKVEESRALVKKYKKINAKRRRTIRKKKRKAKKRKKKK